MNNLTELYIYIYIYIYIVIHRQICFVLSEHFSVARQARFLKLGSKPGWLKRQSKILPLSHMYIYIIWGGGKSKGKEYPIWVLNVNGYRRIINLGLKIHQHSTCGDRKSFYIKIKTFTSLGSLYLVVMTIIRCSGKKLFGCSYIDSGENGIWK